MKKILPPFLALLLLVSGMHLSVASHYCGGMLAQVKWSFDRELASCGMEGHQTPQKGIVLDQNCCFDELSPYTIDGQYQIQSLELKAFTPQIIACYSVPLNLLFKSQEPVYYHHTHVFPPGETAPTQVFQENICVFLI